MERRSKFDATLVFHTEEAAGSAVEAFHKGDVGPAMRAALEDVSTDGRKVSIRFTSVPPVELEHIGDGRLTACILHTSRRMRI